MMMTSYSKYKSSGIEWLSEVPVHWEVRRLKNCITRFYSGGTPNSGTQDFYCSRDNGIPWLLISDMTGQRRIRRNSRSITEAGRKSKKLEVLPTGTILYSMYASIGAVSILEINATINQAILGMWTQKEKLNTEYCIYYLEFIRLHISQLTNTSTQANLNAEKVRNLPLFLPPLSEQNAIVRYLDYVERRGRRLVGAKEKLIGLLEEQKQVIIHRAVTRGLDPDVPLKPSGITWLGEVPEHWEVRRLKNTAEMRVSNVDKHIKEGEAPIQLCNYVDVYKNDFIDKKIDFMRATATPEEIDRFRLEKGDVLITKDSEAWDDIGVPALVTDPVAHLITGYHLALFRPYTDKLASGYLLRTLQSRGLAYQFHVKAKGVTRYGLSHFDIKSVWIPLPPLPEQTAIVEYLDKATANIDAAIARTRREIDLLNEYRTRLIADVVTGKLDVREAAATLPDEPDETELPDDDDAPLNSGEKPAKETKH